MQTKLQYDVAVIGGGPAGTMAAIASARKGAKTILIEQNGYLGGMLTVGGVGPQMTFHAGKKQVIYGLPNELVDRLKKEGFSVGHI
ncbi:MAG: glucose-inhibited division protein, partial [Caproiciproducens sp.]|nr:glucose-inhibited division protein [Caproiciproducens sp.]